MRFLFTMKFLMGTHTPAKWTNHVQRCFLPVIWLQRFENWFNGQLWLLEGLVEYGYGTTHMKGVLKQFKTGLVFTGLTRATTVGDLRRLSKTENLKSKLSAIHRKSGTWVTRMKKCWVITTTSRATTVTKMMVPITRQLPPPPVSVLFLVCVLPVVWLIGLSI